MCVFVCKFYKLKPDARRNKHRALSMCVFGVWCISFQAETKNPYIINMTSKYGDSLEKMCLNHALINKFA